MPRSSCVPVVSGKAYSYPLLPVTTIAPRPIASKNCSAALGSGNTQRRNIAATWSCVMASPLWSWPMTWKFNLLNCSPVEIMVTHNRDLFQDFQFTTKGNASQMLEEALGYAREHGLPKVYILIDEYDNFTNQLLTAYKDPLYEQITTKDSFLRTFFKVIKKRRVAV